VDVLKCNLNANKGYLKKRYDNHHFALFVGQLDKSHIYKGINYFLDAILLVKKEFENIVLLVVGKGDNIKILPKNFL